MKRMTHMAMMALIALVLVACAEPEKQAVVKPPEQPAALNIDRSEVHTTVATVEAVDLKTRIVKMKSLQGHPFTIRVGEQAVNLPQVKVGDKVEITYTQELQVRLAEPGEVRDEVVGVVGRAKPGSKPAGVAITEHNVTATIMALDKANQTATLKFPDGKVATVKVQNPENLDKVKVGDRIAIKHIEALEIKDVGQKR